MWPATCPSVRKRLTAGRRRGQAVVAASSKGGNAGDELGKAHGRRFALGGGRKGEREGQAVRLDAASRWPPVNNEGAPAGDSA